LPQTEWPADKVERRPVADLLPYARNARTHSDAQVAQIAASIHEWGWRDTDLLKAELSDLKEMGAELSLIGFGNDEVAALLSDPTEGLTDPDDFRSRRSSRFLCRATSGCWASTGSSA
jgi:hypothetical protein